MALAAAVPVQARQDCCGTLTGQTVGARYGVPIAFSWTLLKRPQRPTLGVLCRQAGDTGTTFRFIGELSVPRAREGAASMAVSNATSQPTLPLDETQPATCQAAVWDEYGNGQQPSVITPWISFGVSP